MIRSLIPICTLFLCLSLSAQKSNNIWYFGQNAGLDFNTTPPTAITGPLVALEGTASISDPDGNLLFYTNGLTIWDREHNEMPNGTGLIGGESSTQAALIVPHPGFNNRYYVFTPRDHLVPGNIAYSVVDMCLRDGLGDVIESTKNTVICDECGEKLSAVLHENGTDVWILTHERSTNNFRAYLLSSAGLSDPVVTSIGAIHPYEASIGPIKASHSGDKVVCLATFFRISDLFDFDRSTGMFSNYVNLRQEMTNLNFSYGAEFSPNDSLLYITTTWIDDYLHQYDLHNGTQTTLESLTGDYNLGALQIGPDDKIYIARRGRKYISVIDNPDVPGTGCDYIEHGLDLADGTLSDLGFPNFVPFSYTLTETSFRLNLVSTPLRPCTGARYVVEVTNTGAEASSPAILLELDSLLSMNYASVDADSFDVQSYLLHPGSIEPGKTMRINVWIKVSCDAPLGYEHCSRASLTNGTCVNSETATTRCVINTAAIDPNFKVDGRDFSFAPTRTAFDDRIEYQIHFQNTGTAPAEEVIILDTLPADLDASTFNYVASSHAVEYELIDGNILAFTFHDIFLPDSVSDEPASHGFVVFELTPNEGIPSGKQFFNDAAIYFDHNDAVMTNLKEHQIACRSEDQAFTFVAPVLCWDETFVFRGMVLNRNTPSGTLTLEGAAPNGCDSIFVVEPTFLPAIAFDSVSIGNDNGGGNGSIFLYPVDGTLYNYLWSTGAESNSISGLSAGTYGVTITDNNGCVQELTFEVSYTTALVESEEIPVALMYPNPASGVLHISIPNATSETAVSVEILTPDGRQTIVQHSVHAGLRTIDMHSLPAGLYFCKVRVGDKVITQKIVKE